MRIEVLLSSGDLDEHEGMSDAIDVDGTLYVVSDAREDVPGIKTVVMTSEEVPVRYRVHTVYAPGMWMRAEYLEEEE